MIRNIISTLVMTISMATLTTAQIQKTDSLSGAWQQIHSLIDKGLPQSAAKIARQVLATAQEKKDTPNAISAQLFLMDVENAIQDDAAIRNIQRTDSMIRISAGAEKALWQSINAEQYWQYYQRHRWTILGRTPIVGTPPQDVATWDAASFINKASDLYQASLLDGETLKAIPVERYAPLLLEGKNTRHLRPTLYDFLAFRAIEFFQNDEKEVIRPAYQFQVDGTLWFEPAAQFSQIKVNPADPGALHFRALHTYQQILAFHLNDEEPDALIDADLQRLAFVHQYSVHPDKDSLYLKALRSLEKRYPNEPAAAQATYQRLRFLYDNRLASAADTLDLQAVKQQLDLVIDRFPGTEGASNAAQLRHALTSKSVDLQSEAVILPGENSKVLVTYQNLDKVFLRIYRLPAQRDIDQRGLNDREQAKILEDKPLRTWEVELPGSEDLYQHRTELKIDPLSPGSYLLVVSAKQEFTADENALQAVPFQVSNTSVLIQSTEQRDWLVALHRKSGMPLRGAQVVFWENNWNPKTKDYEYIKLAESRTDEDGKAAIAIPGTENHRINRITLIAHGDTLQTDGYYHSRVRDDQEEEIRKQTFLFTDRAIYRPGQTIYFKGIMVAHDISHKSNAVLANEKTEVKLYDANNQQVTTLQLTTNAYGSFSGKFTTPSGGLTGEMRIANDNGTAYFSVEEYKRPKFQVAFDTVKLPVALNEQVTVAGRAQAYAGNNIDGADVKYRVVRRAHFPYFWAFRRWGQPRSPEMEVANGTVQTNTDGSFEIPFATIPDRQIDPETLPVFTYTVYADVTDINGETQSGSQEIHAGYRALQIDATIPEQLDAGETHQLIVQTRNLNEVPTPANVSVSVAPLQFPGKLYRKRLWEKPDRYLLSESEFRAAFPDDEYGDEADYMTWQAEKPIWNVTVNTGRQTEMELPATLWKDEGWHLIELRTEDAKGNTIMEKKYVYVSYPTADNKPQTALSVNSGKQRALEPGETLAMTIKTGYDSTYVLESNTDISPDFTTFSEYRNIERPIGENDRGGLEYRWIYIHNNRVYTASQRIEVPWSNRDLKLEWATHRNKLLPGEPEEWRLTITGNKKDAVAAELVAGLYDASLDALRPHSWTWDKLSPTNYLDGYWDIQSGFGLNQGSSWQNNMNGLPPEGYNKRYDMLFSYDHYFYSKNIGARGVFRVSAPAAESQASLELAGKTAGIQAVEEVAVVGYGEDRIQDSAANKNAEQPSNEATTIPARTNLQETAFFLPELATDAEGNITLRFTMPEALTEWKLMALAHTTDWKTGYVEGKVKTQKDLMAMPNLPRFLRQGDDVRISTKISNTSTGALAGVARLTLLDATTLEPVSGFGEAITPQDFAVNAGQSTTVDWMLQIPENYFSPVVVRITAKAGNFTDGEENTLPVISNRMLVTETLPLPVRGNESKTFTLPKLLEGKSNTLTHHALTVEFTGNPAWYAVQALPYLLEYPYECAEQVFNRFYATALAAHIVAQSPRVKAIFDQWRISDTTALLSNLEKNQELKSALLEETPWVMEAKDESEQKRRIALLFDSHKLAQGLQQNLAKLAEMQLPDGSFPWFRGMMSNRYITQYIATGLARLQKLGVEGANTGTTHKILASAVGYADRQVKSDYDRLLENKADLKKQHIDHIHIQYLYMRSLLDDIRIPEESQPAYQYYIAQAETQWPRFNPYLKGQLALALNRGKNQKTAAGIMESLRETAMQSEEMGMYWKAMPRGYWWYEAPIEAQALLIEAFAEVAQDPDAVDDLKVWLLKQKQTQHWNTTKATADAIYALLLQGSDWLSNEPVVTVTMGPETIRSTEVKTEAGTGYFKKHIEGDAIIPAMGNISVQVDKAENEGVAWGAVYWQYFENLDKITGAETPLSLRKQLYIERNTDRGPILEEITPASPLKVGDKVNVRIEIRVDRDMEYVHLKDMRAACFEPINVLSGYHYQGGLGYYESTRDVSTNFFFDYLRKGTYVIEYPVFVSQAGDFSNGISAIQSMYAPEFSSHSEGMRVTVAGE